VNAVGVLLASAWSEQIAFTDACNASHPMWERWRNRAGYFVVRTDEPCWVGAATEDLRTAFARWIHSGAPGWNFEERMDRVTVLLVDLSSSGHNDAPAIPGRHI
jgi:hypothetical protein